MKNHKWETVMGPTTVDRQARFSTTAKLPTTHTRCFVCGKVKHSRANDNSVCRKRKKKDEKEIISRKLHTCSVCGEDIFPGTSLIRILPQNRNKAFWTHLECFEEEGENYV